MKTLALALVACIVLVNAFIDRELIFPKDFQFGVATASYQIEGAWNESGKGESIWDRLTHEHPDWVKDKSNGDIACDSYHNYPEDIKAISELGANFYRFSISWPRLLPEGYANRINPSAVAYYNSLIDALLAKGIESVVTLFHWDLPQALQNLGGWTNNILAVYFEDYADIVFRLFGDRVRKWITFNEPVEVCESGYGEGDNAPAYGLSGTADYLCGKTLLLAHARAYRLYNKCYREKQNGVVGITVNSIWSEPKNSDVEAARRYLLMNYGWWTYPIFSKEGDFPEVMRKRIAKLSAIEGFPKSRLPVLSSREINMIKGTADFLGLNHYSTWLASENEFPLNATVSYKKDVGVKLEQDPTWKPSSLNWLKVVPWGFRKLLNWIKNEFGNPIVYVTENGFADIGGLNDSGRIDYHNQYLCALLKAVILDGCNIKAYTIWSLMDNMEWREGYTAKFGLYNVDFNDVKRKRTPKASANFYANVIKTRMLKSCNL